MSGVYDAIIVGAGIAGSTLACALSQIPTKQQLRILLIERQLSEPHRIVGELLQPGGVEALKSLGIYDALEGIGAVPVKGYGVINSGKNVHIPYPKGYEGRSFHHGRFVQSLRRKATTAPGIEVLEAAVSSLVECPFTGRVLGVKARRKGEDEQHTFLADLTFIADGHASNLRSKIVEDALERTTTKSYFYGLVLNDVALPYKHHGTVALIPGSGPVLLYQIEDHDTRILIDIKAPLPKDVESHIKNNVVPHLPHNLHLAIYHALESQKLPRMPNSFLPAKQQGLQGQKEGCVLVGDSWNMRHPLTGAGMTVAITDVVKLKELFTTHLKSRTTSGSDPEQNDVEERPFADWDLVSDVLRQWHWSRKPLSSTINILSVALYDLFGAKDENLQVLRTGCFKYFELGGECINGPVSLLSGVKQDPVLLFLHFFAVAFYSIWVLFTHPRPVMRESAIADKPHLERPGIEEYPFLAVKSVQVFWTAVIVFAPLVWSELRWW